MNIFYEVLLEGDVLHEILLRVTMTFIFINSFSILYSKFKEIRMLKLFLHDIFFLSFNHLKDK